MHREMRMSIFPAGILLHDTQLLQINTVRGFSQYARPQIKARRNWKKHSVAETSWYTLNMSIRTAGIQPILTEWRVNSVRSKKS